MCTVRRRYFGQAEQSPPPPVCCVVSSSTAYSRPRTPRTPPEILSIAPPLIYWSRFCPRRIPALFLIGMYSTPDEYEYVRACACISQLLSYSSYSVTQLLSYSVLCCCALPPHKAEEMRSRLTAASYPTPSVNPKYRMEQEYGGEVCLELVVACPAPQ